MPALLRYQAALLLRSYRWLPPLLLYAIILAVGVRSGEPVLGSLGVVAVAVLPTAAWLVRVCVTGEPPAARAVTAAAAGPGRVHLACLAVASAAATATGCVAVPVVAAVSAPYNDDLTVGIPTGSAVLDGLLSVLACALLGTAAGALCNPPVLRRRGWPVPVTALAALLVLVASGSPANAAVTGLVTGSASGHVTLPLLPLGLSLLACAAATAVTCRLVARR
ncbi:ABC transporter [Streptomyces sp. SL13]|uniref:ABC transporter n=1 Tax=Streptantibioticus silvisoli TaxID=2705255 RepID=A0AA90H0H2_9ACTN|nr:ABC transporter [Streptantibioticus silvisoli]MDI5964187.1 ABC transporter [Streptantibioticus silvisoli]MDI5971748.1 ABC transporter [Streptantibioticus silvisoli]